MQVEHLAYSSSVNHCSLFPIPFSQHLLTREEGEGSWVPRKGPWTRNQRWGLQSQLFHPRRDIWSHRLPLCLSLHICIMEVEKVEQTLRVWHSRGHLSLSGHVSLGGRRVAVCGGADTGREAQCGEMAGRGCLWGEEARPLFRK